MNTSIKAELGLQSSVFMIGYELLKCFSARSVLQSQRKCDSVIKSFILLLRIALLNCLDIFVSGMLVISMQPCIKSKVVIKG